MHHDWEIKVGSTALAAAVAATRLPCCMPARLQLRVISLIMTQRDIGGVVGLDCAELQQLIRVRQQCWTRHVARQVASTRADCRHVETRRRLFIPCDCVYVLRLYRCTKRNPTVPTLLSSAAASST